MGILSVLTKIVVGVPLGIAAVTALPIFGAVGAITATGIAVGAAVGAVGAVVDELAKD